MNSLVATVLIAASGASASTNPFACVDPDVAAAFLGHWYQDPPTFSTAVASEFVSLRVPEGFGLVGSQSSALQQSVFYKTDRDVATALSSSLNVLKQDGWMLAEPDSPMGSRGFQPQFHPRAKLVCRDSAPGVMSVMGAQRSGNAFVSFTIYAHQRTQTCSDLDREQTDVLHYQRLGRYMPNLDLPNDAKSSDVGGGGSGDEMSSRVTLSTSLTREELLALFAEQIRKQGWLSDSAWSGSVSSGTVWSLVGEEDGQMVGVLRVTEASSGLFNVRFSISPVTVDKDLISSGAFSSSP